MNWIAFKEHQPPQDTSFLVTFDGYWVKAHRGNQACIVLDLFRFERGDHVVSMDRMINENKYWLPVPPLPD